MAQDAAQKLECDLVMRGGITSGIVYPRAIAKLAETYKFRSIGGTSAGAIAAAATAAAAYGAKGGEDHFQTRFKELPGELAQLKEGKSVLERLFQPQAETRRLFRVLMAGLEPENLVCKILRLGTVLCLSYWPFALLGAAIALVPLLAFALTSTITGFGFWVLLVWGLVIALAITIAVAAGGAASDVLVRLPKNRYGLCSGSSNGTPDGEGVLPLTDWLHEFFQDIANRPLDEPVTFGELWGNGGNKSAPRDIELVLMTTNITRGISQRLPFIEGSWGQLFFNKADFDALFPASVVTALYEKRAEIRTPDRVEVPDGYYALPDAPNLPILLGARMSLSFPFLLSAVPLYAANVTRKNKAGKFELERCWFSDGGMTSNFPIHFFDAPLPARPTFGINLVPASVAIGDEAEDQKGAVTGLRPGGAPVEGTAPGWDNIYMPSTNSSGIGSTARFNGFDSVIGFFSAMFDTARNWADTELVAMPGYRDRVVNVALSDNEGGLNLRMKQDVIERIGKRGERAGELLAARFAPDPKPDPQSGKEIWLTWDNHRWVRFRSFMAALEELARRLRATWRETGAQGASSSFDALLNRAPESKPRSYPFGTAGQREFAIDATNKLVSFVETWTSNDQTFDRGEESKAGRSPRPKPVLRMMPPGSNDPRSERADMPSGAPPAAS